MAIVSVMAKNGSPIFFLNKIIKIIIFTIFGILHNVAAGRDSRHAHPVFYCIKYDFMNIFYRDKRFIMVKNIYFLHFFEFHCTTPHATAENRQKS